MKTMFKKIHIAPLHCIIFILVCSAFSSSAQDLYKTPSGEKYHLGSCRMVKNVSTKLVDESSIRKMGLGACKICKPPEFGEVSRGSIADKSVGQSESVQCLGKTKSGSRCKHKTKIANGYCYQHGDQAPGHKVETTSSGTSPKPSVNICGAKTKSNKPCQRKVSGGGSCYQHS
jgi:hypothetical protein